MEQWNSHLQKTNHNPYLIPYTHTHTQMGIDLNVRTKPIKLIDENIRENLNDLRLAK